MRVRLPPPAPIKIRPSPQRIFRLESIRSGEERMSTKRKSRRSFLFESAAGLNAAWVAANYPGILAAQQFVKKATDAGELPRLTVFTEAQAAEIEAITAQIIPTDNTPGAKEAR